MVKLKGIKYPCFCFYMSDFRFVSSVNVNGEKDIKQKRNKTSATSTLAEALH